MKPTILACLIAAVAASHATNGFAEDVDYQREIRPLLIEKCSACHGAIRSEAGLRLDAGRLIHRGGDNGRVLDTDAPGSSRLLQRVTSDDRDERMPPEGEGEPLDAEQVRLLTAWIASGATYPPDEAIPVGPDAHWAYQRPVKAAIPDVADRAWAGNPIDAFVVARLRREGLQPAPPADRRTALRRVSLDLVGLPPTPAAQRAFLDDDSDDAWSRVVDRLLDDPAHGERWGRHWMDVWRYSDWDGYKQQLRGSQRHVWRWRDWIVESLNEDKPYDRMIVEMLAGDEIAPEDRGTLRATGYLARSYHKSNRNIWLDATVEHSAKAFLAMTINCARCHDHKYDPIGQREYYALRAVFEPHEVRTERVPGETDLLRNGFVRAFDAKPDAPTYLYRGGNEKLPVEDDPVEPATPRIVDLPYDPQPIDLPPVAVFPALREFHEREALEAARGKLAEARRQLSDSAGGDTSIAALRVAGAEAELAAVGARWAADRARYAGEVDDAELQELAEVAWRAERSAAVRNAELVVAERRAALATAESAEPGKPTDAEKRRSELAEAEKKLAAAEGELAGPNRGTYTPVGKSYPARSTGRRLGLANWIVHERNPLTARVAVNHVWMRHFGEPLVENVFDFGMRTAEPIHRELLDWLAVELMENGWSTRHLHRLIVTSRTYRTSSAADPVAYAANLESDPDNHLLWRANVRRLDAEVVRDSLLAVAGSLDRSRGGPEIDHTKGASVPRRSLYFRHAYEKRMRMLGAFDGASPGECYRRSESIVPQQALALTNGTLAIEQSRVLAASLSEANPVGDEFVRAAFVAVLCRDCTPEELAACSRFLSSQADLLSRDQLTEFESKVATRTGPAGDPAQRARENLVHVLFNHNDFVTMR